MKREEKGRKGKRKEERRRKRKKKEEKGRERKKREDKGRKKKKREELEEENNINILGWYFFYSHSQILSIA